jgi:hypothetical protein
MNHKLDNGMKLLIGNGNTITVKEHFNDTLFHNSGAVNKQLPISHSLHVTGIARVVKREEWLNKRLA